MTSPTASTGKPLTRRVGVILPSVNATTEPELYRAGPPGFTFHSTRILLQETTTQGLRRMNDGLHQAATLMRSLSPDVLVFACTSGSFIDGWEGLQRQLRLLSEIVGCPVLSTSEAMVNALRHAKLTSISLATPYVAEVATSERLFLENLGFEVIRESSLGLSGTAIREVTLDRVYKLAEEADSAASKAVYISCTDLVTLDIISSLEHQLGKPVLSSNQVTLWAILTACGWSGTLTGYGSLLDHVGEPHD